MTDALAAFHLIRPVWLLALVPALLLWWLHRRHQDSALRWRKAIDPALLRYLMIDAELRSRITPSDALLLCWIVATVAIAGPTWRLEPSPFAEAQPPAMILLKTAPSMTTTDLPPTRLERAQQKIADLLALREGAATGLIAYSGSAHLVLPPTADRDVIVTMAKALSPAIMPNEGDHLAEAIALATSVLQGGKKGGSILVLADTVAPDQIEALRSQHRDATAPSVTIHAVAPPAQVNADPSLERAASALDADLETVTIDPADVTVIARRLARATPAGSLAGESQRWQEAGYWLTPLLAFFALSWFRRGWVLAS
jgi:Ca-activated chloride channel family protein